MYSLEAPKEDEQSSKRYIEREEWDVTVQRGSESTWEGTQGRLHKENNPQYNHSQGRESQAHHWINVAKYHTKWDLTDHYPTDLEPYELSDRTLNAFFKGPNPKRIQYYGPDGISMSDDKMPRESCVRINVKLRPYDTKVGIPTDMKHWKKTTLIQRRGMTN